MEWRRVLSNAHQRLLAGIVLPGAILCAAGCEPRPEPHHYTVLAGKVVACHTDTGELSIRASRRTVNGPAEQIVYCLVTRDSEIYVNDKFSSIEEIQLGDAVELVGRRDPAPQLERFVVSFAYFDHPLPPPPRPELTPAPEPPAPDTPSPQNAREE
jgi:hypothetical protein